MATPERYWLVHPNGGRQLIDPRRFDLEVVAEQARRSGARLVVEPIASPLDERERPEPRRFEPPISALAALFRSRFERIYLCEHAYKIDINIRPTQRVLGGYYKKRGLVRIYSHDKALGRRPLEELYDTFLHEMAHHLEYTEPHSFQAKSCERVHGRMHSDLFWRILGDLKHRWMELQRRGASF